MFIKLRRVVIATTLLSVSTVTLAEIKEEIYKSQRQKWLVSTELTRVLNTAKSGDGYKLEGQTMELEGWLHSVDSTIAKSGEQVYMLKIAERFQVEGWSGPQKIAVAKDEGVFYCVTDDRDEVQKLNKNTLVEFDANIKQVIKEDFKIWNSVWKRYDYKSHYAVMTKCDFKSSEERHIPGEENSEPESATDTVATVQPTVPETQSAPSSPAASSEIKGSTIQDAPQNSSANQAQDAAPKPAEPEVKPAIQPTSNSVASENTQTATPPNSPTALVTKMLELAVNNGGRDYEREIQQHKTILEQMPKPKQGDKKAARVLNDKALAFLKAKQYESAVQSLSSASKLDPSDVEIINNLGFAFLKQGNLDQAQNYLVTCLAMAPDRSAAWSNLADVLALKGNMQQSVAAYANVYRFSKNRAKTHQFLKDTNSKESNANLIQARQAAMNMAEKMYTDVVGP